MGEHLYRPQPLHTADETSSWWGNLFIFLSSKPWAAVGALVMLLSAVASFVFFYQFISRFSMFRRLSNEKDEYLDTLADRKKDKKHGKKTKHKSGKGYCCCNLL